MLFTSDSRRRGGHPFPKPSLGDPELECPVVSVRAYAARSPEQDMLTLPLNEGRTRVTRIVCATDFGKFLLHTGNFLPEKWSTRTFEAAYMRYSSYFLILIYFCWLVDSSILTARPIYLA